MRTPKVKVSEKLIPIDPYSDYWWGDVKDNLFSNRMITLSLFPLLLTKIYKRLTLPIFKVSINMPTRLDKKIQTGRQCIHHVILYIHFTLWMTSAVLHIWHGEQWNCPAKTTRMKSERVPAPPVPLGMSDWGLLGGPPVTHKNMNTHTGL